MPPLRTLKRSIIAGDIEAKYQSSECGVAVIALKAHDENGGCKFTPEKLDVADFIWEIIEYFLREDRDDLKSTMINTAMLMKLTDDEFELIGAWIFTN